MYGIIIWEVAAQYGKKESDLGIQSLGFGSGFSIQ